VQAVQVGQARRPVIARARFIAAAAFAYARTSRPGPGAAPPPSARCALTMSPRYVGSPAASTSALRGLAYWPAMRPTLTTGIAVP
jgi:hypothetical protein